MIEFLKQAGIFAWPLGLCSVIAVFVTLERLIALRPSKVIPRAIRDQFALGEVPASGASDSVAGRILLFYYDHKVDAEQLKAFARLQVSQMERGLFLLDTVVGAAPLLGLLGTVTGLVHVFGQVNTETGIPEGPAFVSGVALALSTTVMGLAVAIPSLVASQLLYRKIDAYTAQLGVGVERIVALKKDDPVDATPAAR